VCGGCVVTQLKNMELFKFIVIIVMLGLSSCSNSKSYNIEKKFKTVVDNENCKIEFYYPMFEIGDDKINVAELNGILENLPAYQYYAHKCNEKQDKKTIIKGDYEITLETDDTLSIEFITKIIQYGGNKMDTVYHSLVINPKKVGKKEAAYFEGYENLNRCVFYDYVSEYNKKNKENVNLLAYENGSNYAILWGFTEKDLILYIGGEGEGFGYDKIKIPISELKEKK
jgi:hypothetical protein